MLGDGAEVEEELLGLLDELLEDVSGVLGAGASDDEAADCVADAGLVAPASLELDEQPASASVEMAAAATAIRRVETMVFPSDGVRLHRPGEHIQARRRGLS